MKNRIILLLILFFSILLSLFSVNANEQFNFDVTEIEVTNDGNTFKGYKGGTATTQEGLKISAEEFEYDKILNILIAKKKVKLEDSINDYVIFADKITYFKNKEEIFTDGKTKAIIEKNINLSLIILNFLKLKKDYFQIKSQQ